MTYTIEDIEGEVSRALRQLDDCRNNYSPTEFFDDLMARAAGALIHQQELLRRQHEAIVKLRESLTELSGMYVVHHNASTRAKQALKDTEENRWLKREHPLELLKTVHAVRPWFDAEEVRDDSIDATTGGQT